MSGRVWLSFYCAVFIAALCFRSPHAHQIPCFNEYSGALTELAPLRGYGLSEEGLIKLSVNSDGTFLLTLSPPCQPLICVFVMGENWEWVRPKKPQPVMENIRD